MKIFNVSIEPKSPSRSLRKKTSALFKWPSKSTVSLTSSGGHKDPERRQSMFTRNEHTRVYSDKTPSLAFSRSTWDVEKSHYDFEKELHTDFEDFASVSDISSLGPLTPPPATPERSPARLSKQRNLFKQSSPVLAENEDPLLDWGIVENMEPYSLEKVERVHVARANSVREILLMNGEIVASAVQQSRGLSISVT